MKTPPPLVFAVFPIAIEVKFLKRRGSYRILLNSRKSLEIDLFITGEEQKVTNETYI